MLFRIGIAAEMSVDSFQPGQHFGADPDRGVQRDRNQSDRGQTAHGRRFFEQKNAGVVPGRGDGRSKTSHASAANHDIVFTDVFQFARIFDHITVFKNFTAHFISFPFCWSLFPGW